MSGVVVGVDGSRTAMGAAVRAATMADSLGQCLHIVTAARRESLQTWTNGTDVFVSDPVQAATQLLASVKVAVGATKATTTQVCDSPSKAICAEAERIDAELIVVGNRRVQGAARVLGSIATDVLRHAHCDVLVVDTTRDDARAASRSSDRVDSLSMGTIFHRYTPDQRRQIDALATSIQVKAGRSLTEQGRVGREFGVLLDGTATVTIDGNEVARLGVGDHFGELALLEVRGQRAATIVADCDLRVAVMSTQEFEVLVNGFSSVKEQLERQAEEYSTTS